MKNLFKTSLLLLLLLSSIIAFPQVKTNHFEFNGGPCCEIWTIYIGGATFDGMNMEAGDEIAIFDGEILVGAMELTQVCTPDNWFENALPAWSLLFTGTGYTPGNIYSFKAWNESAQVEANEFYITLSDPYGGAWMEMVFPPGDGQYSMVELEFFNNNHIPIIDYNPTSFTQLIEENSTAQDVLNIISAGCGELIWNIEIVYSEKSDNLNVYQYKENWLVVNPLEGILEPGETENVTLEFNSNNMEVGTYNANIIIYSNDENNPEVIVPVIMIVEGQPEPHFNFEGGDPSSPIWIIYLSSVKTAYPYTDLVAGDEIAIFDGDLMVGAFTLDQVCTPDNQFENDLLAFSILNTQPGYQAGNEFSFKGWDASEQEEKEVFIYEFFDPYGDAYMGDVFPDTDGEFSISEIIFLNWHTQAYNLIGGYQFISSNVIPEDPDMTVVLSEILNDNLDFVRNTQGQTLRKIGPNWVNNIGNWLIEEAYLIHMFNEDSFSIGGFLVDPDTPIQLSTGYQMVSYFPENSYDALQAFNSIIGENLDFIRNSQGYTLHKIGPNWINGIGNCIPGEGYLIKMFADDILNYSVTYPFSCGESLTDPRDGQIYNTVQIGDQCWMAENLNIGTMINGIEDMTNNNVIEKYCYDDNSANCDEYGGLYQWNEMMQYSTTQSTQGICPDGWHLPSDAEWFEMENYLDPSITNPNTTGFRGIDCGEKMLEGGSSGFEALLAGKRWWDPGEFELLGEFTLIWSSTIIPTNAAYRRALQINNPQIYRNGGLIAYGHSVRCLRDEINTCVDPITDTRDGQVYNIVQIGDQCWMAENLNIGTRINGVEEMTDNGIIEKYCYSNNFTSCDEKGGLYQWDEMMQYTSNQGEQGICPDGWYIPSDEDWKILEGTVDSQYPVGDPVWDIEGWRGFDVGLNLKFINGWLANGNGTNDFGFSALPGGYRMNNGDYSGYSTSAYFWSSTEKSNDYAWSRALYYSHNDVNRHDYEDLLNYSHNNVNPTDYDGLGFSVRCLRDETSVSSKKTTSILNDENYKKPKHSKKHIVKTDYFTFNGGNPADPVYTLYLEGLEIGDEVAAYDGELLVGSMVITSEKEFNNEFPVFSTTVTGKGYEAGKPIILKVWDISTQSLIPFEYTMIDPYNEAYMNNTYPEEDGLYSIIKFTKGENNIENVEETISIFPNPSEGIFNISIDGMSGKIQVKVFDIHGNDYSFFEIEVTRNLTTQQLDLKELSAGVYFISFSSKDFSQVKKILIQ